MKRQDFLWLLEPKKGYLSRSMATKLQLASFTANKAIGYTNILYSTNAISHAILRTFSTEYSNIGPNSIAFVALGYAFVIYCQNIPIVPKFSSSGDAVSE